MDLKSLKRMDTHTHSEYSNIRLLDSINRIPDMMKTAHRLGMSGIVLTDHECLSGHVKWLQTEKSLKEKNILPQDFKAALGNEIYLVDNRDDIEKYWHYILVAKNFIGHRALRELSSKAWYHSFSSRGMTRVPTEKKELEEIVKRYPNSLIATNACLGGFLGNRVVKLVDSERRGEMEEVLKCKKEIDEFMRWNINLFGDDFYVEIAAGTSKEQIKFNQRIGMIAKAYGRKIIIGSDSHYCTAQDRPIHKAYLNSKEGDREVDEFYFDAHMMDNEEAFDNLKNIFTPKEFKEMCDASMEIYDKIEYYTLEHSPIIPEIAVAAKAKTYNEDLSKYPTISYLLKSSNEQELYWINECLTKLKEIGLWNDTYLQRIEIEADIIKTVGDKLNEVLFKYFNTFQHYIDLFWDCGSIVGPGRGSSVCFLSNYLLGITQLDPIAWELPEWRFLNKERVELPDVDTDLSPSKRAKIFEAIRQERGELNLIQVCTFGTEGTRSAIAAAGRGYRSEKFPEGLEVETTQYLSSLVPQERGFLWSVHDVVYGNEEKGRAPVQTFISEVNKYPGLLEIIESIEGIVNKRGQHASGVILYNNDPFETGAIMRSPNGDLTTQFSLHDAEWLGDVKYDFLVTEVTDKLVTCLELLQKDGLLDSSKSLRELYNEYLHPAKLNLKDQRLWDALSEGKVLDVFQFNTGVGLATAKQVKPQNPQELSAANTLMRLMGEKGKERPLDRYCRMRSDIGLWYKEVRDRGLTEEEIRILEPYYLPNFGVPASQEDLMMVCMDPNIGGFTLKEANAARKTVAKKRMAEIPTLKEKFVSGCPSRRLGEYVWETTMGPQMGYAFAKPHSTSYSFVGIQTLYLATNFPAIYWNCACLIVNAGGTELLEADDDTDDEEETTKKKNKSVNYGKISAAIGESKKNGILILPPNINESDLIFKPDLNANAIIYGMKGCTRIGTQLVYTIFNNRPYSSVEDFLSKVKVNKLQMLSLIKAGAFDSFGDRIEIMNDYLLSVADQKKRITLQNMNMLINKELIPESLDFEKRLYNFNKYIKNFKEKEFYRLNEVALKFFRESYDEGLLEQIEINETESALIKQSTWDSIYKKGMNPMRDWMKANQDEILAALNYRLFQETWDKYAKGSISQWEMESLGFYYHDHELANLKNEVYGITDFYSLKEEPVVDKVLPAKDGSEIKLFKLCRIAGTAIDRDKNKGTVTLLTPTGVVNVKVWKNQFAAWDKQIFRRNPDGTKTILEKSWFVKGNKLIITGIRRGDDFVPKKYKNTEFPLFEKIISMDDQGFITASATERMEGDE